MVFREIDAMDGTVVIMDYSEHERKKVKLVLENMGDFNIVEIGSSAQYASAAGRLPHISLIIMDIAFPYEKEGFEVLALIRKNSALSQVPVIITTRSDSPEYKAAALKYSVRDYILKPYQLKRLESSIRSFVKVAKKFIYTIDNTEGIKVPYEEYIAKELSLSARVNLPLSILLITSIKAKEVKDGEKLLPPGLRKEAYSIIARAAGHTLRSTDTIILNKDRDILVVLPGTTSEGAKVAAEKARLIAEEGLGKINVRYEDFFYSVHVTFPEDGKDFQALMEKAFHKISDKEMLEKIVSIPVGDRKYVNRRYNQFRKWF